MNFFKDKHLPNNHSESIQDAHTQTFLISSSESHTPAPPQRLTGKHPKFSRAAVTGWLSCLELLLYNKRPGVQFPSDGRHKGGSQPMFLSHR